MIERNSTPMLMIGKIWGIHMKTTIDISDALLPRAKQLAATRQQTLKSLLETTLRQFLVATAKPQPPFRLRKHTFCGRGLQSHRSEGGWATVREQIYEGRGMIAFERSYWKHP
jgi:hypothetical protein